MDTELEEYMYEDAYWLGDNPEDYEDYPDYDDIPIKCNACFGTGLDRDVDADCMNCCGDGYV